MKRNDRNPSETRGLVKELSREEMETLIGGVTYHGFQGQIGRGIVAPEIPVMQSTQTSPNFGQGKG